MGGGVPQISERLGQVRAAMKAAALRAGRDPRSVRLVAVSKTVDPARVREAYEAGARRFGESYVQEALDKVDRLPPDVEWHMIGHLQTNKAKRAAEIFGVVETVDRPHLAEALERSVRGPGAALDVLIQVKLGAEETKHGASPDEAVELARRAREWPHLRIRGLMTIPPYHPDPELSRPPFRTLRELGARIAALSLPGVEMEELSMGMSHDFPIAVEEGATLVRVGSAIFGERE